MTAIPRAHDAHVHLVSLAPGGSSDAPLLLREMDANGIGFAAVSTPSTMGWNNETTMSAVAANPGRLVGVVRVDLSRPDGTSALGSLLSRGAVGLRVTTFDDPDSAMLRSAELDRAIETLVPYSAFVEFHSRADQITDIGALALRHPDVTIVIDHLGRPDPSSGAGAEPFTDFLALSTVTNIVAKSPSLSHFSAEGPPYTDLVPFLRAALDSWGADRLMWGSDWPGSTKDRSYAHSIDAAVEVLNGRSAAELHAFFRGTFERVHLMNERAV